MKAISLVSLIGLTFFASSLSAQTLNGKWTNPVTGQTAASTIEVKSKELISYCTTTDKKVCWDMQVDRVFKNGALEVRQDAEHKNNDGTTLKFEHVWTFTPTADGYDGIYEVQVQGKAPEFRASASYR